MHPRPLPTFIPLPSPGLEMPHPRLVTIPDRRVCMCGKPLQTITERQEGECEVCEVLNRFIPRHPCAGDLFPLKGF